MNKVLSELSILVKCGYSFSTTVNEIIEKCEEALLVEKDNKVKLINEKVVLIQAKRNILNYIRRVKTFKEMNDIQLFKTLVRNVVLEDSGRIRINLNLIAENIVIKSILEGSIELRVGNENKTLDYYVSY